MKRNRPFPQFFFLALVSVFLLGARGTISLAQEAVPLQDPFEERIEQYKAKLKAVREERGQPCISTNFAPAAHLADHKSLQQQAQKAGVTLVVTNTNDSGDGSLRWAIQQANLTTDLDIIVFNIPGSGPHYIQPTNRLGYINNPVIIDGTTQPGWAVGAPVIVLDGSLTPDGQEGFRFYENAHGSEIRGLVIGGFDRPIPDGQPQAGYNGFAIVIEVNNAKVQGNFLGIAPDGVTPFPNVRGVQIMNGSANLVGGVTPEERNVISNHLAIGVAIFGNEVRPGPNSLDNVISGNYIGTDVSGTADRGNSTNIQIAESASNTLIGGTSVSQRNIISGAEMEGILIVSPGTLNTQVKGNFIGTDVTGTVSIPNELTGVSVFWGPSQTLIGGAEPGARNIISGNGQVGIELGAGFGSDELPNTYNVVAGNYIGLDINDSPMSNDVGILINTGSQYNTVGGTTAAERNIISGNNSYGIIISGDQTKFNQILGNYIGTNPEGTAGYALTNGLGISIQSGANNNTIGGLNPGEGNLISGNYGHGIIISGSTSFINKIFGNLIGTNASGTGAVGNRAGGIGISSSPSTSIQGNVISGNGNSGSTAGIEVIGTGAGIRGNKIGVDITGQVAIPNIGNGIILRSQSSTIGGVLPGQFNIISGNTSNGILLLSLNGSADTNYIWGNYIGTNPEGLPLGNGANGIDIGGGSRNQIGRSDDSRYQNKIAHNAGNGVSMSEFLNLVPIRNEIRGNSIYSNSGHGILLGNYSSIPGNDPGDADTGPNQLQNFPEISSATFEGGQLEVSYFVPSDPVNARYIIRVDFFSTNPNERQGKTFLGFDSFQTTDFSAGTKTVTLPIPAESGFIAGQQITATATDGFGNTSHFGALFTTQSGQMVYTITSSAGTGGSIDPLGETQVEQGGNLLFTITPDTGYETASLAVNGQNIGAVGQYLFENVTSNQTIVASFQKQTFTVTASAGTGGAIDPSGSVVVEYGDSQSFTVSPDTGYEIDDVLVDEVSVGALPSYNFENVTADHAIVASFKKLTFTIAASAGTGGSINPFGNVVVEYGENLSFVITPDAGYEIADVLVDNVSIGAVALYTFENATADHTIEAQFSMLPPDLYTLSLQVNPIGAGTVSGGGSFEEGQLVPVSVSANAGYDFVNWTLGGVEVSAVEAFSYEMPAENVTLVANFEKQTFTIAASAGTGGLIDPVGNVVVEYGDSQSFVITPDAGYEIADVLVDNVSIGAVASYTFENVTADHTIEAQFSMLPPDLYTLTLQVNPMSAGTVSGGGSFEAGQLVPVSASANAGYDFVNWTRGGVEVSAVADFSYEMPAENVTLVANFEKQTFTIAASAGTGGLIDPVGNVVVEYGDSQSFVITPDAGYEIADVLVDNVSIGAVASYTFENVTADHTIEAQFSMLQPDLYTLTLQVNPMGAGNVSGGGSYEAGQLAAVSATANAGYDFVNWTRGGVEVSAVADFSYEMPAENVTLVANFEKQTFTIVASAGTGGSIDPVGSIVVEYGGNQNFVITADSGYEIADVLVDGLSVGPLPSYTFNNVMANHTIEAQFDMLPVETFTLTLQANPEDGGMVYGAGEYEAGAMVNVSALANAGYRFVDWTKDGQFVSGMSSFVFTMPAMDVTLVASFEEAMGVYCTYSQGYWFAKDDVVWPYDVVVGGHNFTQAQGQQFWPSNTPTQRAFTQYATIYLSGVTLSEFPELEAAMQVIDNYFATTYPAPAGRPVNSAAGFIGDWIDQNHCVETQQGIAVFDMTGLSTQEVSLTGDIDARAYPNPFRRETTIAFMVQENVYVTIEVFNMVGERISLLFEGNVAAFEQTMVTFKGNDLPNGFYFYRVTAGRNIHTGRLILTR